MKFGKVILFDLKHDAKQKYGYLIYGMLIAIVYYVDLYNSLISLKLARKFDGKGSFMDYWICLFQGKEEYSFSVGESYDFPTYWFLLFVFVLIPVCIYTWKDMHGFGRQIMIKSCGKGKWLLSKYLWALTVVVIYFVLLLGSTFLFCKSQKIPVRCNPTWYMMEAFGRNQVLNCNAIKIGVIYFLVPFLMMILMCWLEITLITFMQPSIAFVVSCGTLIISAYKCSYFLPGNWGMPVRLSEISEDGLSNPICLILMLAGLGIVVTVGMWKMHRKDVFD